MTTLQPISFGFLFVIFFTTVSLGYIFGKHSSNYVFGNIRPLVNLIQGSFCHGIIYFLITLNNPEDNPPKFGKLVILLAITLVAIIIAIYPLSETWLSENYPIKLQFTILIILSGFVAFKFGKGKKYTEKLAGELIEELPPPNGLVNRKRNIILAISLFSILFSWPTWMEARSLEKPWHSIILCLIAILPFVIAYLFFEWRATVRYKNKTNRR